MNRLFSLATGVLIILAAQNCADTSNKTNPATKTLQPDPIYAPVSLAPQFGDYWYQGKGELCAYDVVQERYGEVRRAEQVNIFVTEDLSKSKQVKLDDPSAAGDDKVPVLKLNALRKFETGIYDYSLMQSVFTPIDGAPTLKTTATVQDWCGHVFMQTNLEPKGYRARIFSYFESEGDQDITLPLIMMEDELWTRLRLNPFAIKTGKQQVLPSTLYARLRHKPLGAQEADIQFEKGTEESALLLTYSAIPRSLRIRFETEFPHKILGWEETNEGQMASKGVLKSTRRSAYWAEHNNENSPLRDSLKILRRKD